MISKNNKFFGPKTGFLISKRGVEGEQGSLNVIIIFIVSFILLFLLITPLIARTNESIRDKGCEGKILIRTLGSIEYGPFAYQADINTFCPSYTANLGDKEGEMYRGLDSYHKIPYLENELTEKTVNILIGDEMQHCWEKYGAGKLDAFYVPRTWLSKLNFFKNDAIGCVTCTNIIFDLSEKKQFFGWKKNLEENHKNLIEHDNGCPFGKSCWEEFAEENNIPTDFVIDTAMSDTYMIVFVRGGIKKGEGVLNTYLMSPDTVDRVCVNDLPYTSYK